MSSHRILNVMYDAPFQMLDPGSGGTINVAKDRAEVPIVSAGAEARTLAQPTKAGLMCKVVIKTYAGAVTLTVTGGWNQAGDTTMTFDTAGDWVLFHSIQVGTSYYWRVVAAVGVAEIYAEEMDVHALTALGAAPDVADLVPVADESATSDPTRSVTVTQLLTAAGDLTDLGAVPAVDDRILLTDESASGDPAKSTTVENFLSAAGDVTDLGAVPAVDDRILLTDESAAGDPAKSTTVENLFSALGDVTALGAAPATDDILALTDESAAGDPIKAVTVAQLFQAYFNDMTPGTGISGGVGTICEHSVEKIGGLIKTTILVDLTGLNSGGADGDIIGKNATANCHIGQIVAAVNGTIFAGKVTCLETPAGGEPDIDLYSATESNGTEDDAITGLEETALLDAAADWTAGAIKVLSAYPATTKYLYLVASGGATDATYTAGILLIELWGTV